MEQGQPRPDFLRMTHGLGIPQLKRCENATSSPTLSKKSYKNLFPEPENELMMKDYFKV